MKRLTSNKEVSEMGMYELAHNACYVKDGKARYRDFESDLDARELAIKLLEKYADIPNEFTREEDFEDFIVDSLQYGLEDIQGLIAIFYRNMCAMADLREALKVYEDAGISLEQICEPEYLGENIPIGCRDGRCRCGNIVRSYQNYCDECGIKLEWGNVHG